MNKKVLTGAIIALAAGIAAYIYNRKRNRISTAASDAYDTMDNAVNNVENQAEHIFS